MGDHDQQRDEFVTFYETYFGKFDAAADLNKFHIWCRFIDRVPLHKLEDLMEKVSSNRGKSRWRPTLEDFKSAWRGLTGQQTTSGRHPGCEFCDGTGTFGVIGHKEEGGWKLGIAKGCAYVRVPCLCDKGERFATENSRDKRHKSHRFKVDMLGEMQVAGWGLGYDCYLYNVVRRANGGRHSLGKTREELTKDVPEVPEEPEPEPEPANKWGNEVPF